jgi:transketolase
MSQATQTENREALIKRLEEEARQLRIEDIRMLVEAGSGHPGGTLSMAEMIAALYFHKLRLKPNEPEWPDRDRFVLSKGHTIPIVYAALARIGMIPTEWLSTLRKFGSPLQGHPDRQRCPGVEANTGSLGQGLSISVGLAVAAKHDGSSWRTYCMMGDGETQSGQIWEAAMLAGRLGLGNLVGILDNNQVQQSLAVKQILDIDPVAKKYADFNWHVVEVDGHDMGQVVDALDKAESVTDRATLILSHTIKGKGVSWMELNPDWHGKAPSKEEGDIAIAELEGRIDAEESKRRFEELKKKGGS